MSTTTMTLPFPEVEHSHVQPSKLNSHLYDVAIIGGGPSGLSAAINASSDGLSTLMVEGMSELGGQIKHTSAIENLMGQQLISGKALIARAHKQAQKFGTDIIGGRNVCEIAEDTDAHCLVLSDGTRAQAKSVIIASGLQWRELNADGEYRFRNKGVYYGPSTSLAYHQTGQTVVIVGGANSAGQAALHWSKYAQHVYLIVRGESLTAGMSMYLVERVTTNPKVTIITQANVTGMRGDSSFSGVYVRGRNVDTFIPCHSCLIFIGSEPRTNWMAGIERDAKGYVVTDQYFRTSRPGVFAIGDVRNGIAKRVSAALGDGSAVIGVVNRHLAGTPIP